ncbi:hypothetical protein MRS44_003452 [Fusarium solani]|uniref:uncharacterized protein n=1 Tax=Fusarium solani TaxID=169388 RepID=UPI0032C41BDF|nr:hypothetical protein MRS44_003452 [Fusarium solani]
MEPLEIVGAAAAIAQLLKLTIDIGNQARKLVQSSINAPKELAELNAKIDRLSLLLHHANELNKDLADANASDLIPEAHSSLLYSCLGVSLAALERARMLHGDGGPSSAPHRLRWAAIDKRKTQKVLKDVKESEAALDIVLNILGVRLASFNRASIAAVQLGQETIRKDITSAIQELALCFQAQSGFLETKVVEASTTAFDAVERVRQEQQTASAMFNEVMTRVLDSQERAEARITKTQTRVALELSSLKAACQQVPSQTPPSLTFRDETMEPSRSQSPTSTTPLSPGPSTNTPDDIFAQARARTEEWRWKQPLARQNWLFKPKAKFKGSNDLERRLKGSPSVIPEKNILKARGHFKARVNILAQEIICLEIKAQHFTQAWLGMPSLFSWVPIINIRPHRRPMFQACARSDLPVTKRLLETGEASIHGVDQNESGLLEHVLANWKSLTLTTEFLQFPLGQSFNQNALRGDRVLPAMLKAFANSLQDALPTFLFRGAQLGNSEAVRALLSRNANTILEGYASAGAWQTSWTSDPRHNATRYRDAINLIKLEGVLFHLLWHYLNPHAKFVLDTSWGYFALKGPDSGEEQPFEHATLFYETISTEEGRRQLARFPLARLLVNALQLAGYRAEMDDDGDDEDGDQYFDAREYQPEEGVDDGLVADCPICQDPEKCGLGHVFAEAERGRDGV